MSIYVRQFPLTHGYTIDLEYCGKETAQHVVRQYGEFVNSHETRGQAEYEIEIVRGGNLPS